MTLNPGKTGRGALPDHPDSHLPFGGDGQDYPTKGGPMTDQCDPLLSEAADRAATDRIAWAMLVVSGEQSPRAAWAERADEWRTHAEGVWRSALTAARAASDEERLS